MTDKELAVQKRRVQKLIDKWFTCLGMRYWSVTVCYSNESRMGNEHPDNPALATAHVMWEYCTAEIVFYLPALETTSDKDLEEGLVHECMHILVSPMAKKGADEKEELTATILADAFIWVAGMKK